VSRAKPFDGVHKAAGVRASGLPEELKETSCWVTVQELSAGVQLLIPDFKSPVMTIAEARSLAAQIMETARRHEIRKGLKP
jgi:hypothetical protein